MNARILIIAKKEARQLVRDTQTLVALVFVPLFLLVMFGYAISLDVKNVTMAIYDEDMTTESRALVSAFVNSSYFERVATLGSVSEIDERMASEEFKIALVIPHGFSKNIVTGRQAVYQAFIDGSNSTVGATVVGYVNAITQSFSARMRALHPAGLLAPGGKDSGPDTVTADTVVRSASARDASPPIDIRFRTWYNPELKSSHFLVPGLIAFIMVVSAVLATSLSIVREKERGSMEQLLVSPVTPMELVIGKTLPYIAITLLTATGIIIASYVFFGIVVKGSLILLFVCTMIFLFGSLGLGILISTIADSQQVAFMLSATVTMLPTFILSGFVFPIRNMPFLLQLVTYALPARYFLAVLRAIILKGVGIEAIWPDVIGLVVFMVFALTLGIVRLHREMRA
jgi:ABC-2 type transport system permease protein